MAYEPGLRAIVSWNAVEPPGAVRVTVTSDGRTTLYESDCFSATPSPFGETTASAGGGTYTPIVLEHEGLRDRTLSPDPRVELSTVPSKAIVEEPPPSNCMAWTAPRRIIVSAISYVVIPTEYPGCRPSTTTIKIRPSASWPTAVRGCRREIWYAVNASLRPEDWLAVSYEQGPASHRVGDRRPVRREPEQESDGGADGRLGPKPRNRSPARDENGASGRYPRPVRSGRS